MKKILKWVAIVMLSAAAIFYLIMFKPWVLLPHKHISISLPFAESEDYQVSLIPMGEKIEHNEANGNPDGHAGIDFGFQKETQILSVADGWVSGVDYTDEGINVVVLSGAYKVTYKELNSIEPGIHFLTRLEQGQVIGVTGCVGENCKFDPVNPRSSQLHWEFSSASMYLDRLCPLGYFDESARARVEAIWDSVPEQNQFKIQYPLICNGFFEGRED